MKTRYSDINCKSVAFTVLLLVSFVFSLQSQVTIGMQAPSLKGAILDMKESVQSDGSADSEDGMMMARIFLSNIDSLSPILTGADPNYATLKPSYTGLIVYNVNTTSPLEKGLYIWDGNTWNKLNTSVQNNLVATNGLNSLGDTIKLGGDLIENTAINFSNYNLNFNPVQGKIGIGTSNPQAIMQVENPNSIDPLLLKNVNFVTDANNTVDGSGTANYTPLMASDSGVIRKATPAAAFNPNASYIYNLTANTNINTVSDASGSGGTTLAWTLGSNPSTNYITLPETGTYIFTFRLYGHNNETTASTNVAQNAGNSYYLNAFKNGTAQSNLVNTQEFLLHTAGLVSGGPYESMTYSITISVSGLANDTVYFTMGRKSGGSNIPLTLIAGTGTQANRTSMVYWML